MTRLELTLEGAAAKAALGIAAPALATKEWNAIAAAAIRESIAVAAANSGGGGGGAGGTTPLGASTAIGGGTAVGNVFVSGELANQGPRETSVITYLTVREAEALAQFVKAALAESSFHPTRCEAELMRDAIERLRRGLQESGFNPR